MGEPPINQTTSVGLVHRHMVCINSHFHAFGVWAKGHTERALLLARVVKVLAWFQDH